jgi:hypothetical protein
MLDEADAALQAAAAFTRAHWATTDATDEELPASKESVVPQ